MRYIYSLFMYLIAPYFLFSLWWKGRKLPAYRQRIKERFALNKINCQKVDIWFHCVSLGEVIALTPLIEKFLQKKFIVLVTTTTPTGSAQVIKRFADKIIHQYLPYDLPDALMRFLSKTKPGIGIIAETEIWPNLIHYTTSAKIPLFLVNARLSEHSFKNYSKISSLLKPILNRFTAILVQTQEDGERFKKLGARPELVEVIGNVKFDLQINQVKQEAFMNLKERFGSERQVVIIASTHENEEELFLARFQKLQEAIPNVIVLIAPRHPERLPKVYELCVKYNIKYAIRSQIETINSSTELLVIDSFGELLGFYAISDYAFVGGSLVSVGGHNVLEAIAMGVPVFSGPHFHNFHDICSKLIALKGIIIIKDADDFIEQILDLQQNSQKKLALVKVAQSFLENNQGAVERYTAKIIAKSGSF